RGEDLFREHFGPLYYSVDYRDAHFVVLYSEEALESRPRIGNKQFEWLRQDLESTDARHIFVIIHKPMWEYDDVGWERVHELLRRHPVRAVIGGHFHHYYKSDLRDGIQYYVIGVTGGRTFSPELAGGLEHYCLLYVEPDAYELVLVRPGCVLPDDYITGDDFKAMEKLRFLSRQEVGVTDSASSPELGPVRETVSVLLTNPLDRPVPVTVRPARPGDPWRFRPDVRRTVLAAGARERVAMELHCPALEPSELTVPELEIEYEYVDSRGRSVPIVLRRRVPLRRQVQVTMGAPAVSVDGRGREPAWADAPVLSTARWETSPYESAESGPRFHLLATRAGLYLWVDSPDQKVSTFQNGRMLSDAVFISAMADLASRTDLEAAPTIILYPSPDTGDGQAVQAPWDERSPLGMEVEGVYVASRRSAAGGWQCEAFIPWRLLLAGPPETPAELAFNVGAWDNDGELFTELHSWAPTGDASRWGRLVLQARPHE
ncbi:MAG: metallophosphoesterase, partial [Candidatus Brocadiia bacterium]